MEDKIIEVPSNWKNFPRVPLERYDRNRFNNSSVVIAGMLTALLVVTAIFVLASRCT